MKQPDSPVIRAGKQVPAVLSKKTGLLALLLLVFLLTDISFGPVKIPLKEVIGILFSRSSANEAWVYIVQSIRVPKAITALLVGCALPVAGLQMQTLFRNPLAGPSELGLTAGASLGVALVMLSAGSIASVFTIKELGLSGSWLIIGAASLGAAGVMLLIVGISATLKDNVTMLIVGVMTGNIILSVVSIWQYFSAPEQVKDFLVWTFGSLGGTSGTQLYLLAVAVTAGLAIAYLSSKRLNTLLLGAAYARTMGLTVHRARLIIIASTSLLAGSVTAFCGPIGFVGIAVPHLTRSLFNTSDHGRLIPACCLVGTTLMLGCDLITQLPGSQSVLPINVVTALIGSPVVIWIIVGRNNIKSTL